MAISLVLLLTTIYVSSVSFSPVKAQGSGWITSYQIYDYTTKGLLINYDSSKDVNQTLGSISPGQQIYCTFTVNVFTGGSGDLSLSTSLHQLLQGEYWQLVTQNYTLGNVFNPNSNHAQFVWAQGAFTMTVYGIVPTPSSTTGLAPVNVVS